MKAIDLKAFRKINSITQVDLANYLGVGQGFISQIEKGQRPLPKENISRLLANPYGWDVSMLTENEVENPVVEQPQDMSIADKLFALVESQQRDIKTLLAMLKEKDEEISRLREELDARKRGCASNVAPSSNATAV